MDEPDFHALLQIEPGREAAAFPLRLRQLLTLEAFHPALQPAPREALDALYAGRGLAAGDFAALAAACEQEAQAAAATAPPAEDDGLRFISGFDGLAEMETALAHYRRLDDPTVRALCRLLLDETRRRETALELPPHWSAGHFTLLVRGPLGAAWLARGQACYGGQDNPLWEALRALARRLFAEPPTLDQAALELWDEALVQHANDNAAGAADALRLARELPRGHYRVERLVEPLLESSAAAVRWRAAELLAEQPVERLLPLLQRTAMAETAWPALAAQVVALRRIGGGAGFDALLALALGARRDDGRRLATRALAWVEHCPDLASRLRGLVREPLHRTLGAAAWSEYRHQSVMAQGAVLAAAEENAVLEALRTLARRPPGAAPGSADALLEAGFAAGRLRAEVVAGADGRAESLRLLAAGGTPLVDEHAHATELAARLARLAGSGLADWALSDAALAREAAARRARLAGG